MKKKKSGPNRNSETDAATRLAVSLERDRYKRPANGIPLEETRVVATLSLSTARSDEKDCNLAQGKGVYVPSMVS